MRYAVLFVLFALTAAPAAAQGIIIDRERIRPTPPRPPMERAAAILLRKHSVRITIEEQVASTEVTQVFFNPNGWQAEGIYLFPLPDGASVSRFTMMMGDKEITGEVLDANKARDIYLSIVQRRRDPGLLEYAGRRLIRARIFPIPPRGETRITLRFEQLLKPEGGLIEMTYPLRSDKFAPGPVEVAGRIEVRSQAGLATLFSPSHKLDVVKKSGTHWIASFEESRSRGDRDLQLLYSLGKKDFGVSLTTHKPAGEDGYFLLLVAPNTGVTPADVLPKDVIFVIDTSGSMGDRGGTKMKQAKAALSYAIGRLNPGDRFNVIAFSTEARPFRDKPIEANPGTVAAAVEFVNGLEATGGTAIHDALVEALRGDRSEGRLPIVIFLTDGQPTIGPTDTRSILQAVEKANAARARLFVFGVGDNLNAELLTELAGRNGGSGNFVSERENIEVKVSALYDKVASPVLTDLKLTIPDLGQHDVYPRVLGDLFKGQQLVVVGRYSKQGPRAITLSGKIGQREVSYVYEAQFDQSGQREFLPRLWAVRKVGFMLDEIRRNGEQAELVAEIKRLGIRHGIVTPYTSFLVVEEEELLRRRAVRFAGSRGGSEGGGEGGGASTPQAPEAEVRALRESRRRAEDAQAAFEKKEVKGKRAVAGARIAESLKDADEASEHTGVGVKTVAGKTFRLQQGVWVDTALEAFEKAHPAAPRKRVICFGEGYEALLADDVLARYLAAGTRLRLVHDGTIYEIVDS